MARKRERRLKGHSLNRLIPNSLTILALCAGVTAMRFAVEGHWERAVIAVVVAAVLDGLDGRIARALGATSRFGAELDSLSDFICFGVAPAFVVYLWSLQGTGGLGWALALLFAVCCALRLARFNVALTKEDTGQPAWQRDFFVGVPAPSGGGLVLMPLIFGLQFEAPVFASGWLNGLALVGVAALMASRMPTFAFKRVRVPGRHVIFALLGVGAFAAFLISTPWVTLGAAGLAYLASIPYAWVVYQRKRRLSEALGKTDAANDDQADGDEADGDEADDDQADGDEADGDEADGDEADDEPGDLDDRKG
jgi:CDP-diacylglycerol--serine O-phosphatidyltransferase